MTVRASRSAWNVASLPVAVSSTFSSEGTASTSRSASSISTGVTPTPISPVAAATAAVDVRVVVAEERRPEGGVVVGEDAALRVGERRAARRRDDEVLEPGDAALAAVDATGDDGGCARSERGGGVG